MNKQAPNIIVITADQWRADALGVRGSEHPVLTPHLDQLSDEGVSFSNAWADCPISMPQRATFLTGMTGAALGITANFHHRTPVESKSSLPALLRQQQGYQCVAIGKTHVIPDRARLGFDDIILHPDDYVNYLEAHGYGGFYRGHGVGGNEVVPAPNPLPEQHTSSRWITDRAIEFLYRRDPEVPFFLWIIYEAPHAPFDPPKDYVDLYRCQPIPHPRQSPWEPANEARLFRRRALMHNWDRLSPEWLLETRRHYYAQLTYIDYQLGRFFGELKSRNIWDQSEIIFNSDHGEHLGDFGLFGKGTFLRGSGDIPLIIKPSSGQAWKAGSVCHAPVQSADLPLTIAETAGVQFTNGKEPDGISLAGHIADPASPEHEDRIVFGEFGGRDCSLTAIGNEFRLVYYPEGGIEHIFPVQGNDTRLVNVHDLNSSGIQQIAKLRSALIGWIKKYERPYLAGDTLLVTEAEPMDEEFARAYRSRNPMAWRGPIRYGRGYGGGY